MLHNVEDKRILHALDRESRLAVAFSASIMLALDPRLSADDAVHLVCKVFGEVFPEKADGPAEKTG